MNYSVPDLVLGPGQDGRIIQSEGGRATALNASQQSMLRDLIGESAGIMNDAYAESGMAEIKTDLPQTYFAWSGPTANGSAWYFRIQGPTLVIEYAPQDGVDHIHTIYRDPTNDYGGEVCAEVTAPERCGWRPWRSPSAHGCRRTGSISSSMRPGSRSNAIRASWR